MASLLDPYAQPIDRTTAIRSRSLIDARDDLDAERKRRDQEMQIQADQEAARQRVENLKQQAAVAQVDAQQWAASPEYQGGYAKSPAELKQHFLNAYDPIVAAQVPQMVDKATADVTGKIPGLDDSLELSGVATDREGNVHRSYARKTANETGVVTEKDLAEAGVDPSSIPRNQWAAALAARKEPVKPKLDVQQKAALGAAAQSVAVLGNALQTYDSISGKAGPLQGRINQLKGSYGVGDADFAKANAELQGNLFNVARSLQGAGVLTEMDIKRMEEIAPSLTQNREQFSGQVDAVKNLMRERLEAWRELNSGALDESQRGLVDRLIKESSTGGSPAEVKRQTSQSITPKVGEVRRGYRFKGGNPGDKASWEPAE